jgi:hypothetical protein
MALTVPCLHDGVVECLFPVCVAHLNSGRLRIPICFPFLQSRERSGNIQRHSGNIQGTFGAIQGTFGAI